MSSRNRVWRPYSAGVLWWLLFFAGAFAAAWWYAPIPLWVSALLAGNIATFFLFGVDKLFSQAGFMRIPEVILYSATIPGAVGTLTAMQLFRHKTRKVAFQFVVYFLVLVEVGLLVWFLREEGFIPAL